MISIVQRVIRAAVAPRNELARQRRLKWSRGIAALGLVLGGIAAPARSQNTPPLYQFTGPQGGPFPSAPTVVMLSNTTSHSFNWGPTQSPPWLTFSPPNGSIPAGGSTQLTSTINQAAAAALAPGLYTAKIGTLNGVPSRRKTLVSYELTVTPGSYTLVLTPVQSFNATGIVGGPFTPANSAYTLANPGAGSVQWTSTAPAGWLSLDKTSGTLLPGQTVPINVSVNQSAAAALAVGNYPTSVVFQSTGVGTNATLNAALTVNSGPGGSPLPMTTATRTSGVAPLLVVFDAVNTASPSWSSGVVQPANGDFAPFQYSWDFGDVAAGTWSVGALSRNKDTGYVAAHVFEQPGAYHVTLRVTTPAGVNMLYAQDVTVAAFTGTTYYVSSSTGNNSNPGTNMASPLATFDAGIAKNGTNVRILFKRGDTFTTAGARMVTNPGPGIVGAYGTGADPKIQISSGVGGGAVIVRANDWRISDLDFIGTLVTNSSAVSIGAYNVPKIQDFLALRVDATNFDAGIEWNEPPNSESHETAGIVDCHLHDLEQYGLYVGALRLVVLGNRIENITVEHVLRVWHARKSVIAHNYLATPGPSKHAIKLHNAMGSGAPAVKDGEYIQIADNEIRGISQWSVAIGPQHAAVDERVRNVVFERNRSYNAGVDLMIWARNVTVRNNIFDGSTTQAYPTAVWVGRRGIEPASDNVKVYNNTVYQAGHPATQYNPFYVEPVVTSTLVENNVVCMPNSAVPVIFVGGTPLAGLNNRTVPITDFVNALLGDFRLNSWSLAAHISIPLMEVREDFNRVVRPLLPAMGALEN
ncbi:MAG TPA: PKD domain-containing protein [Planctomycetota bacterium]|nr:PKD domain-containing protein [Planctomycetota bacterium]